MATYQLRQTSIIDHHTPASTATQKELQGLVLILILHSSIPLLLTAMASHVLPMKSTAHSHALYAQNDYFST